MTISTQDCKDFISSISKIIGSSDNEKWKRTKKYKENNLVLRDFENQDGRILTIVENQSVLSIYQVQAPLLLVDNKSEAENKNEEEDGWGTRYLGHQAKPEDIAQFLSDCISADPEIVYNDADTLKDASNPNSWKELWVNKTFSSDDLQLYYIDESGNSVILIPKDVRKIHVYFMPDYDTAYRISVFETKDKCLYLGTNDPD